MGEFLTADKVDKIVMEYYRSEEDVEEIPSAEMEGVYSKERGSWKVTVTDKNEIRQILDSSLSDSLNCTNYLNNTFTGVNLTAYVSVKRGQTEDEFDAAAMPETVQTESIDGREQETEYVRYGLRFDYDKIPDFVKETFKLTEENMKNDVMWGY